MSILSNRNREIKQILQNTQQIMDHFGIQQKVIEEHTAKLIDHDDRIEAIEARLREKQIPHGRRAYVLSADARQVAEDLDLTITDLYRILRHADMIIPDSDHTTQKQRVEGELCRVLVLKRGDSR